MKNYKFKKIILITDQTEKPLESRKASISSSESFSSKYETKPNSTDIKANDDSDPQISKFMCLY